MANVAHSTLTGSNLHEPKGVASATAGQVYIADGAGSGAWTASSSAFPGQVSDFYTPVAPSGWLELDGSTISTTTYSALFTAVSIQQSGSRGSGSALITNLSSTTNMRAGYYVFGTGITTGSTIISVDSSTQITISINAGSSGTATVFVSPCLMNTGTFTLPNTTTSGRFRRSRTSAAAIGVLQADSNKTHIHNVNGTTGTENLDHSHTMTGAGIGAISATAAVSSTNTDHNHLVTIGAVDGRVGGAGATGGGGNIWFGAGANNLTSGNMSANSTHTHSLSGHTGGVLENHAHTVNINSGNNSDGGTETRPFTLICMTCIKT